jgi:phosphoribosylformylglycinamidine cyclo-ligase
MALPKTYQASGVNIEAGNELVRRIKPHAARTPQHGVLGGIGGFGALFAADWKHYQEPVLVSATDGVGTKLKLAFALEKHDTIGIDLVAMCANDLLCSGANPLFFLDYFGTGRLQPDVGEAVVKGIADGCVQADCALIGGETAELPGFYTDGEYDLAGFCVGIVDKPKIITGENVQAGDVILGLASSGLHSNGYSLARKVLEPLGLKSTFGESTLGEAMLEPTRIYVKPVLELLQTVPVKALAHITGGGFYENIPRILPENTIAKIQRGSWDVPELFSLIAQRAEIEEREMFTTFNMGIGMVMVVAPEDANAARDLLQKYFSVPQIGVIESAGGDAHVQLV